MSFGRQLPTSARPSIPESYETETIAMEPAFTVGLDGWAKRLVHQEQTRFQELVPRLTNVGRLSWAPREVIELSFVGRRVRRPALAMPLRSVTQASPQQVRRPVAVVHHG